MTQPAKHTPGPWVVDVVVSEDNAGQPTLGIYADGPEAYGYVCGIHCSPDAEITKQDYANAALIAAAPAMYGALKQTFNVMENILTDSQLDTRTPCGLTIREWESKVRIALAQADGKQ